MRSPEYTEGRAAQENFEQGMKALFKIPKGAVVKAEKKARKKRASRAASLRKPTTHDRD